MNYSIMLHPKSNSFLKKVEKDIAEQIKKNLQELKDKPKKGKKIKHSDFWSLRIREYRVIYEINTNKKQVLILYIGNRKNVYDDFSRLI